jgi:hypothetical protein
LPTARASIANPNRAIDLFLCSRDNVAAVPITRFPDLPIRRSPTDPDPN